MEEDIAGEQINEAVKDDEIDQKSIGIVQVLSWHAEKFDHKSKTMKDESNDKSCPKLKNIPLVLSHGGHFASGTLAIRICLDLVGKSEHIKSHQGDRKLRLQNQMTRSVFIFWGWNGQAEMVAILVPGKVTDHNGCDSERYQPDCDKHNPDKPEDLLQKLHVH